MNTPSVQATLLVAPKPPRFKPVFGPCLLANHPVTKYGAVSQVESRVRPVLPPEVVGGLRRAEG